MSNVAFWMIYSTSLVVNESVSARVFAVGSRSMSFLTPSARSCSFTFQMCGFCQQYWFL